MSMSLVPLTLSVFDHLQYAKIEHTASNQNLEAEMAWEANLVYSNGCCIQTH